MHQAGSQIGRRKLDWAPFGAELERRMDNGEAEETVTLEAKYLEKWARRNQIATHCGDYLRWERIRDRIRRRFEGANGYKQARLWKLRALLAKARQAAS